MAVPKEPFRTETYAGKLRRLTPKLKQILRHYEIPAEAQDDLLQEALVGTLRWWDDLVDPEAWLVATLRNRCLVYRRKRRGDLAQVDAALLEFLSEPSDLDRLLEELPPRCQKLLRLRYGQGLDDAAIAGEMGATAPSIQKTCRRCMTVLLSKLVDRAGLRRPGKKGK